MIVVMKEELKEPKSGMKYTPSEHACGAVDEREARMLMHQIMAEIRKSDAPAWVAEELEKKLDCQECCLALQRRFLVTSP